MIRKHKTSVRIFSKPKFYKNMLLIGTHKTSTLARKQLRTNIKYRIDKSKIKKVGKVYGTFVHFK